MVGTSNNRILGPGHWSKGSHRKWMELEPSTAQIACDHASFLVWQLWPHRTTHSLRIGCCPWWPKLRLQSTGRTHDLAPDSHSDLPEPWMWYCHCMPLSCIANLNITRWDLNTQSGAGESTINLQLAMDGYGGYGLIILLPACGSWAFITFIDDEITSSIHSGSKAFDDLPVRTIAKHWVVEQTQILILWMCLMARKCLQCLCFTSKVAAVAHCTNKI